MRLSRSSINDEQRLSAEVLTKEESQMEKGPKICLFDPFRIPSYKKISLFSCIPKVNSGCCHQDHNHLIGNGSKGNIYVKPKLQIKNFPTLNAQRFSLSYIPTDPNTAHPGILRSVDVDRW